MRLFLGLAMCLAVVACDPVKEAAPDARGETPCDRYCDQIMDACASVPQYESRAVCVAYCGTFAKLPAGTEGDQEGNSVECRLYHATVAAATDPDLHCEHAGKTGGDVCGTFCENYCHLMLENCTTYDGREASCEAECEALPFDGQTDDKSGNTVQCRMYYAGLAGSEAALQDTLCAAADAVTSGECI